MIEMCGVPDGGHELGNFVEAVIFADGDELRRTNGGEKRLGGGSGELAGLKSEREGSWCARWGRGLLRQESDRDREE
jgi:hypothetical protein